jgi:hypothetical protein
MVITSRDEQRAQTSPAFLILIAILGRLWGESGIQEGRQTFPNTQGTS